MLTILYLLFLQIPAITSNGDNFKKVGEQNLIFGLLVSIIFVLVGVIVYIFKLYSDKVKEISKLQYKITEEIKSLTKEYDNKLNDSYNTSKEYQDKIRERIERFEDERNKQWIQSEKETLQVLNGVTNVLEVSERMERNDTEYFKKRIDEIESKLINHIDNILK